MQGLNEQIIGDQIQCFLGVAILVITLFSAKLTRQWPTGDQCRNLDTGFCDCLNGKRDIAANF